MNIRKQLSRLTKPKFAKQGLAKAACLSLTSLLLLTACGAEPETAPENQEPQAKKIEIFTVGQDQTPLSFTKNGQLQSGSTSFVIPQTSGTVTDVKVKVGDKVSENQTLITLGKSLSTDSAALNYKSALEGLEKLEDTRFKTDYAAQKSIDQALIGYYTALEGVQNAITSKEHAADLYNEQVDPLEDTIDDLEDTLDDLEDTIPNHDDDPSYIEVETALEQAESQLEQLEIGHKAQMDQMIYGISMAKAQLEASINSVESVQTQYSLQFIQLDSTILQAETGADLARLQQQARNVKAPISGTVTNIQTEVGSFASPGQILLTIEDIKELKVTTFLAPEETALVNEGSLVSITTSTSSTTGRVNYISPTLSQNGKAEVEISLSDKKNLYSGEIVEIVFTPNLDEIATLIPLNSVIIEDDHYFINTVTTDKTIQRTEVTIGKIIGNYVEILDGIHFGEKIALSKIFLRDGDTVIYKVKRSAKSPKS